jgi:hypothetical protein
MISHSRVVPKQKKAKLYDAMLETWWSGAWLLWVVLPTLKGDGGSIFDVHTVEPIIV